MENINFSILFILGLSIFGGLVGASFFQKLRIPQVVGYIVIGLIVGESGLKLINQTAITTLQPFTMFALGIIGFLVGGELKAESFRKYAKQFFAILLGEGLGAFLLVGIFTALFMYYVFHNVPAALAAGIVFGAIASATDPASTIDVLWEYRALGVLTTSLTAIVALDDALAMTLYGLGTGVAEILTGNSGSIILEIGKVGLSLLGAVVAGLVCALILRSLVKRVRQPEKSLAFAIGLILLLISVAAYLGIDVILTSMTLGCILVNMLPRRSEDLFKIMRSFSTPIYVLFFVLAGARLGISQMPGWLWGIVIIYVIGRSAGKMVGAYAGARYAGSKPVVRRYLGLGLFAQGGVAIGLSIMASEHLSGIMVDQNLSLGDVIISGVAATTFIVQLSGPPMVKLAIKLSGEAGRNITRADIIDSWTVEDVMEKNVVLIQENEPLIKAAQTFVENDYLVYPVVDKQNNIIGVMSLESLKDVLVNQDSWTWLVVSDIMAPVKDKVFDTTPLKNVVSQMNEFNIDQMPVMKKGNGNTPVGIIDKAKIHKLIDKEVISRQRPIKIRRYGHGINKERKKMSHHTKLGDMKVADIRHLSVKDSAVINKEQGIKDILAEIDNSRTGHVYVVDKNGILIGTVRMNRVVEYLFPFAAMLEQGSEVSIGNLANFEAETVQDIMDENPQFVKGSTSLGEMADILIREKVNELPIVDDDMHLVGQIDVYEVIMAYLKEKRNKSETEP